MRLCQRQLERTKASFAAFALLLSVHCNAESAQKEQGEVRYADPPHILHPPRPKNSAYHMPTGPGCPKGMARIRHFCMDRFEGHLIERSSGKMHPYYERPRDIAQVMADSKPLVFPQGYLSQLESETACVNAGKRLCTRAEWISACMGSTNDPYPYGTMLVGGYCNSARSPHVMSLYFGGNYPGHYWDNSQFNDPRVNTTPGYLLSAGSKKVCVSEDGVFDMMGNLHEWVSDVSPRGTGTFAGSCYSDGDIGCSYYSTTHARGYHDYSTGFRCCADPE